MSLWAWLPAVSTTALLAAALWLLRTVISTRLTRTVQHEFDKSIENVRADLRKSESMLAAELRTRDNQIAALQNAAISGAAARQAALDRRRLEAVDQLWAAVTALAPAKGASAMIGVMKYGAVAKEAAKNEKLRPAFAGIDPKQFSNIGNAAAKARPFVSELAWALFSAYQAVLMMAVVKMHALSIGLNAPDIFDEAGLKKVLLAALPDYSEYINKVESSAYDRLLEVLEQRLLTEMQYLLKGVEGDIESIKQAGTIIRESERVLSTLAQSPDALKAIKDAAA